MTQNVPADAAHDEVIYSAKYPPERVSVILIIYCLLMYWWLSFTYDIVRDIYDGIVAGEGLRHFLLLSSILLLFLVPLLDMGVNPLLFKEIIFYSNRIEIVRRILKPKTVYYSCATVEKGSWSSGYLVEKLPEKRKSKRTRFFYDIRLSFFPTNTANEIESIFDYLADDSSQTNPRVFKRSTLPKDVLLGRPVQARAASPSGPANR